MTLDVIHLLEIFCFCQYMLYNWSSHYSKTSPQDSNNSIISAYSFPYFFNKRNCQQILLFLQLFSYCIYDMLCWIWIAVTLSANSISFSPIRRMSYLTLKILLSILYPFIHFISLVISFINYVKECGLKEAPHCHYNDSFTPIILFNNSPLVFPSFQLIYKFLLLTCCLAPCCYNIVHNTIIFNHYSQYSNSIERFYKCNCSTN